MCSTDGFKRSGLELLFGFVFQFLVQDNHGSFKIVHFWIPNMCLLNSGTMRTVSWAYTSKVYEKDITALFLLLVL